MFARVLIANRGEIARRVIRTLDRLGIGAVAVYTPADRRAPFVREATFSVEIASYLDIDAVVGACGQWGAEALHPGYGFLSENPALARACAAAGVTFIGPPAEAGELMGDKLRAKDAAAMAGLPVVPSFSEGEARAAGDDVYPLLVKAAAGGGGRGMRVVQRAADLDGALESARREAKAGFGDDRVFIERFLPRARHLEVQVIADAHGNVVHLGERECSLQRRHQKVMEESPSPVVSPELRAALGEEAVALTRAAGYVNAGTVEFIADFANPADHYFLEMNARLQVEHPVTELVTGLDLVELQLRVAAGEPLPLAQDDVTLNGHAIEVRVTAEDAGRDFLPAAGRVLAYARPQATPDVRVDDGIERGSVVDTSYDSLLAKVIAHGTDRAQALGRLDHALADLTVLGVTTTTRYLRGLLADDAVRAGELDTGLIDRRGVPPEPIGDEGIAISAAMLILADRAASADGTGGDDDGGDPFDRVDGWRLGGVRAASHWRLSVSGGEPVDVTVPAEYVAMVSPLGGGRFAIDGRGEWLLARAGDTIWIGHGGSAWAVRRAAGAGLADAAADGDVRAPMPGQVLLVQAATGDTVAAGDPLVVLESMKMELVLTAPVDGQVAELTVAVGDKVAVDQVLATVEAAS
ncbi:MAG TPA: biotin carboxylase N-terminal domain-containing protein [Solirubrobacteraceae bacterium]|nr:biotin carboxylase N-terminal domain-containing protein [Solirubrobacteraceae bacterium]